MANHAGLKKVVKTVRTKKGIARRSYWMRATDGLKSAVRAHGGKVLAGTALLAGAALAHRNQAALRAGLKGASLAANVWRRHSGAKLAETLVKTGASRVVEHYGEKAGGALGRKVGGKLGKLAKASPHGREFGEVLGRTLGGAVAEHLTDRHIKRAADAAGTRLRKKQLFGRPKKKA